MKTTGLTAAKIGRERPMLFSGEMVKAILRSSEMGVGSFVGKTQTRRGMSEQPSEGWSPANYGEVHKMRAGQCIMKRGAPITIGWGPSNQDGSEAYACPYGFVGDRIWVKETFQRCENCGGVNYRCTANEKGKVCSACDEFLTVWKPSIFMPRNLSRITLEITGVRVERLQEISEEDAIAEGVTIKTDAKIASEFVDKGVGPAQLEYYALWESINGLGSWDKNPWVWVITFKRITTL